jgi:hypothetical protein
MIPFRKYSRKSKEIWPRDLENCKPKNNQKSFPHSPPSTKIPAQISTGKK